MSTNSESRTVTSVICFAPDLEGFHYYVSVFYNSMLHQASQSVWSNFVTEAEFSTYVLVALRAYMHLTHNSLFAQFGFRTESPAKLKNTIGNMLVPVYILDMIREICRPMYLGSDSQLVAFLPLTAPGCGLAPGLGYLSYYSSLSELIGSVFAQVPSTPIVPEAPGISPAFISTDTSLAYSNGSTCPQFRLESVNKLRHIRPHPVIYVGWTQIRTQSVPPTVFAFTQLSTIIQNHVAPPARRTYSSYKPVPRVYIYDALGIRFELSDFAEFNVQTIEMVSPILVGPQMYLRVPTPSLTFNYGNHSPDALHRVVAMYARIESELSDPNTIRRVFTFGNTFRYDIIREYAIPSARFPSVENPSKESLSPQAKMTSAKVSKPKKPRQKESRNREEKELEIAIALSKDET